jgi:hypothetical protein
LGLVSQLPLLACGAADSITAPVVETPSGPQTEAPVEADAGPIITALTVLSITPTRAIIAWTTDQPTLGLVEYGTTDELGDSSAVATRPDTTYEVALEGLSSATTYHFRVTAQDSSGTGSTSSTDTFRTPTLGDPTTLPGDTASVPVTDLSVAQATESSLSLRWTQVDDGAGGAASYRVKFSVPSISYGSATTACSRVVGDVVGTEASCTIEGLDPDTEYDVQLMSYRLEDGAWADARLSNVATGQTSEAGGIWVSRAEIAALPTSGAAWENLMETASGSCGFVDLADQNQSTNVCVMAKALVYARTGDATYAQGVLVAIQQIVNAPTYDGIALALGRELAAYVIAADLVDLAAYDPALDELFRTELRTLRTTYTWGAAPNLIDCHERRPNNWGAHCGATRAAIAVYLGDTADLERTAQVFKGYLGDRSSYAGFVYGGPAGSLDLSWQADESAPVGINPRGATKAGLSIDGVLPDDQRRGGSFTTSPPNENYVWEGLQGLLAQAVILNRAGYPVWDWEDQALLRAVRWLHDVNDFPAEGDDTWLPHIVNHYYGTNFPAPTPARHGKNIGWTDWTHGR